MTKRFENSNLLDMRLSVDDSTGTCEGFMELVLSAYELLGKDQQFLQWFRSFDFNLVVADALFSDLALGLAHTGKFTGCYCAHYESIHVHE